MKVVIIAIFIIFWYWYIDYKKRQKEKGIAEEKLKKQKAMEAENKRKNAEALKVKKEKAKKLLDDPVFLKLYDIINNANLEFAHDPTKPKAVYDCYPYNDFAIWNNCIFNSYFECTQPPTAMNYEIKYINYKDFGINENINDEKAELIAIAFGMKNGYNYVKGSEVKIDKKYWNCSVSLQDVYDAYEKDY